MLSTEEQKRYRRQITLSEVGISGQEKLKNASVLMIGAGGLGCPVLQYLTAAGVGTIGVVDGDTVDYSNLQRQILFGTDDVGISKVEAAIKSLQAQNEFVSFIPHDTFLTKDNALSILKDYDIIIDGTDNFETRYLVGDATVILGKPLVFGSMFKFEGQVSVFNWNNGPSYRCLFPNPPSQGEVPNCSTVGVIGALPGVIGTRMANEALKLIMGIGEVLSGQLEVANLLTNQTLKVKVNRVEENFKRTSLEDEYQINCAIDLLSITPVDLKSKLDQGEKFKFLDVREPFEADICQIEGSQLIPLANITSSTDEIDKEMPTIVICHHGMRSQKAIDILESLGYDNLTNLEGGIHAWACEVDQSMTRY